MSSRTFVQGTGLLAMAAMLAGFGRSDADPRLQPPLVRVATAGAVEGDNREFTGIIGARVQSDLGFRVAGKVVARLVDAGQVVHRGQPLMRIDPTDYALEAQASAQT